MDSNHNLRMIHEGRTIVTILVSAGVDPSCLGSSIPGPAVLVETNEMHVRYMNRTCTSLYVVVHIMIILCMMKDVRVQYACV